MEPCPTVPCIWTSWKWYGLWTNQTKCKYNSVRPSNLVCYNLQKNANQYLVRVSSCYTILNSCEIYGMKVNVGFVPQSANWRTFRTCMQRPLQLLLLHSFVLKKVNLVSGGKGHLDNNLKFFGLRNLDRTLKKKFSISFQN